MTMDRFESILDESISALQAGVPLEEVLAEVPDYADELRPLLFASTLLADPNPALVPEEKKSALRAEYLKQVAELPALPTPSFSEKMQAVVRILRRRLTREAVINDLITVGITIILTLGMIALLLNFLATDSMPGDLLYSVKRTSENIRTTFTFNEIDRTQLQSQFNERRLKEVEQLIQQNRAAVVQFKGILETKGGNLWVIQSYPILLPDDLVIPDNLQVGDTVEVIGLLRTNGILVADTITMSGN